MSRLTAKDRRIAELEAECARLRHALTEGDLVVAPCSDEPTDITSTDLTGHVRIYIVWTVGLYPNGVRLLDIRSVTFTFGLAKLYSRMLRRDKNPGEYWERVVIEPRVANHLYAEKLREMMINTGRL